MGGVNEVLAVLLMAAKFNVAVCPHAGGVGLCEYVQHISIFDYIAVSGSLRDRMCEYVDHLHEHFADPCIVRNARYMAPRRAGYSITMRPESLDAYEFPAGRVWRELKMAAMACGVTVSLCTPDWMPGPYTNSGTWVSYGWGVP